MEILLILYLSYLFTFLWKYILITLMQEKLSLIPLIQTNALLIIQQNRFVSLSLIPLKYLVIIELVSIVNNDN